MNQSGVSGGIHAGQVQSTHDTMLVSVLFHPAFAGIHGTCLLRMARLSWTLIVSMLVL